MQFRASDFLVLLAAVAAIASTTPATAASPPPASSASNPPTTQPPPIVESDGQISMTNSTIGTLRQQIKTSPYSTNRAIMREALRLREANGHLPNSAKFEMTFGLQPPPVRRFKSPPG